MVSPEARNSSMRMYQGPMLTLPGGRQGTETPLGLGPHLEVVVDDGHLAVEHEVRDSWRRARGAGSSVSISSTRARRKSW